MLLVQKFLETHTFKELQEQHGVYCSFSKEHYKWSLNYDQLESKENDSLAQECRGLILSTIDGSKLVGTEVDGKIKFDDICPGQTVILAHPMNRFFNYGQGAAAHINFNDPNLSILEKLDGTLTIVYYDEFALKWCVATRSVPEADILLNDYYTFRTLFEKALHDMANISFDDFVKTLDINTTYCFELTSPYNRVVVNYLDTKITLLSARFIDIDKERHLSEVHIHEAIPHVQ